MAGYFIVAGGAGASVFYVNMTGPESHLEIGRYVGTRASPVAPVLSGDEPLWSPSAIRTRRGVRLYAARYTDEGWTQVVWADSTDGVSFGPQRVALETRRQLRDQLMELIVLQDYPKTRRNLFALGVH